MPLDDVKDVQHDWQGQGAGPNRSPPLLLHPVVPSPCPVQDKLGMQNHPLSAPIFAAYGTALIEVAR